jgi:hypothetical protein
LDESSPDLLDEANLKVEELEAKVGPLRQRLNVGLDGEPEEWRQHAAALRMARFPSVLWRRDVRVARRRYNGLLKVPGKTTRTAMAAEFQTLSECVELARSLASNPRLQSACGSHFRGHETAFGRLLIVSNFMNTVNRAHALPNTVSIRLRQVLLEGPSDVLARKLSTIVRHPRAAFSV